MHVCLPSAFPVSGLFWKLDYMLDSQDKTNKHDILGTVSFQTVLVYVRAKVWASILLLN